MSKTTILFKAPAVSVHRPAGKQDGVAVASPAVLVVGDQAVLLAPDAAELLVNYLQVIRAYFFSFQHSRRIISGMFRQVAQVLTEMQVQSGNQVISNRQVSELIGKLGCIDDWKQSFPPSIE